MWYCMNMYFNSSRLQDPSQFHKLFTYLLPRPLQIFSTSINSLHPSGCRKGNGQRRTQEGDTHIYGFQHLVPLPVLSGTMQLLRLRTSGRVTIPSKSMIRSYSSFFLITASQLTLSKHNRPSVNVAEVHSSISPIFTCMDCIDLSSTSKSFIPLV